MAEIATPLTLNPQAKEALDAALARQGLRATRHREHVFAVLLAGDDHPTAEEVYERVKAQAPSVSLATVYNCLDTLVSSDLVRHVNYEREPSRYCANRHEHAHFQDKTSGRVYDIDLPHDYLARLTEVLPEGYQAEAIELHFIGQKSTKN